MSNNLDYKRIYKDIQSSRKNLLVSREGSGKSRFTEFLIKNLRKVIFLSATNKQAAEKYQSFLKLGFKAQLVKSRHYKLKELGVEPILKFRSTPFEPIKIDEDATLELLRKQFGSDALKIWLKTRTDEFDLESDIQIICATFAQKWQISSFSSDSYLVIFDDPDRSQVCDFVMINDDKCEDFKKSDIEIITKQMMPGLIKNFIKRPIDNVLDNNVQLPILFTTTEELTSNLIIKNLGANMLDYRENKLEGNIFLFSTDVTRKKTDYLIPFFCKYLETKKLKNVLIGDGMQINEFNHSNSKGNNQLMETPTIIELSWPAGHRTFELQVEFPDKTQRQLEEMLLTDTLHQALGRNQGYRNRGQSAYVLCEQQFAPIISKRLAYKHIFFRTRDERMNYKTDDKIFWYIHKFLSRPINLMFSPDSKSYSILYDMVLRMKLTSQEITDLIIKIDEVFRNSENKLVYDTMSKLLAHINEGELSKKYAQK